MKVSARVKLRSPTERSYSGLMARRSRKLEFDIFDIEISFTGGLNAPFSCLFTTITHIFKLSTPFYKKNKNFCEFCESRFAIADLG